jgi:hypothetical protein
VLGDETDNVNGASVTFFDNVAANPVSVGFPFSTCKVQVRLFVVLYCELLTCCTVITTDPTFAMVMFAVLPFEVRFTIPMVFIEYNFDAVLSLTVPSVNAESP